MSGTKILYYIVGISRKPYLEFIRLRAGDAHFWAMADVIREKELEHLKF